MDSKKLDYLINWINFRLSDIISMCANPFLNVYIIMQYIMHALNLQKISPIRDNNI